MNQSTMPISASASLSDPIARIEATPVFVPVSVNVGGAEVSGKLSGVVVEITTASGIAGHGFTAITEEEIVAAAIRDVVTPNLLGQDAMAREAMIEKLYWLLSPRGQTGYASHIASTIDIALWDIAGKRLGQPVWKLLGGARQTVPIYTTFGFGSLDRDGLAAAAKALVAKGYRRLKMVVGHHALARRDEGRPLDKVILEDAQRVRAVREAAGDGVEIYIDANCGLDSYHARQLSHLIADYGIGFFEEPLRGNDVGRMADLRAQMRIPVAAGQNEGQLFRFRDLMAGGAVDVLQPNVCICGGYSIAAKAAGMAQAFGIPIDNGGAFPFHNMHLHAGLANGGLVEWHLVAVEMCRSLFRNLPDLDGETLTLSNAPGLGFDIDRDRLRDISSRPLSAGRGKG